MNVARLLDNGRTIHRLTPPLLLDPPTEIAIQADGKISCRFLRRQFLRFGRRSCVLTQTAHSTTSFVSGQGTSGSAIGALPSTTDGDILVGGEFSSYNGVIRKCLVRLNNDGSVDQAFTTEATGFSSTVTSLIQAPDGKIYVPGYSPRSEE
jgi:hypothetical protein